MKMENHEITFDRFENMRDLLTEQAVRDFIEMFYRWGPTHFKIVGVRNATEARRYLDEPKLKGAVRGVHQFFPLSDRHMIVLVRDSIIDGFKRSRHLGGNVIPPTLQAGAAMVLAHELQHANQHKIHKGDSGFFKEHAYFDKATERDARAFADEKLDEICAYFGVPPPRRKPVERPPEESEVDDVIELLRDIPDVTMDDIREELRASKILNPKNVKKVVDILEGGGLVVMAASRSR
jgi:hypothetical protein